MFSFLFSPASPKILEFGLFILRVGIGAITFGHGIQQILGGISVWRTTGSTIGLLGIYFLPVVWGFLAACTQTCGGLALVLGLGTRIIAVPLTFMMIVAFIMHWQKGDPFNVYSFSLALLVIYFTFIIIGSGKLSLDYYFLHKNAQAQEYHPLMQRPEDYL